MKTDSSQKGFTLIELAIVLVIIGIMLGGVLKGQQMIENAKMKAVADQAKSLVAAVYSFQDRYGQFPGDFNAATTQLAGTGCTVANGNNDGRIYEYFAAAEHLACAGFITGSYNGIDQRMTHKYGGNVYVYYQTISGRTGNIVRFDALPWDVAAYLDRTLDDGVYNLGSIRANEDYTVANSPINQTAYFY